MKFFSKSRAVASLVIVVMFVMATSPNDVQADTRKGKPAKVSFYGGGGKDECGKKPCHGSPMACGGIFDKNGRTAASNTYPCKSVLRVCDHRVKPGKCVKVVVTDTGDFERLGRDLDLSRGAAKELGIIEEGVANLSVTLLKQP